MRTLGRIFVVLLVIAAGVGGYIVWSRYHTFMTNMAACQADRSAQHKTLARQSGDLAAAKKALAKSAAQKSELDALRRQQREAERRAHAFNALKAKLKSMIDTGKLDVLERNGRMIVKLPSEVLFKSGEADLSTAGEDALTEVASALKELPGRRFMVAGHTDNTPVTQTDYKDNWELSTARAVTVTEFLIKKGLDPKNLVAAGYGQYDAIASNRTAKGRAENRRIELELLPDVGELPGLIDQAAQVAAPPASASAAPSASAPPAH